MSDQSEPSVSAVIPARDEELNIVQAVVSLAAQPNIREIIVADDQSQDCTPEVLSELRREYGKLRTLRLDHLPPGWMGKTHAAAEGAKLATGSWLLFTDADTRHLPLSLGALLKRAEAERADLLSISPGQVVKTWWEKAVIPLVYVQLAKLYRFEEVSDPRSPAAAANGQYILMRRSVYDSTGGWEAVRDAVLDDVALAARVKSAGGKIVFLPGAEWAETRMYHRFDEMWHGWTKNLFLLYGRDAGKMIKSVLGLLAIQWLPGLLLLAFGLLIVSGQHHAWAYTACVASLLVTFAQQQRYRRRLCHLGFSVGYAKYYFVGAPILSLILVNSLWAYRRGGSIQWKGRTYPVRGTL